LPKEWKSVSKEWLKYLMCMSDYSFPPMLYGMLKRVADRVSEEDFREMVAANQRIRAVFKVSSKSHYSKTDFTPCEAATGAKAKGGSPDFCIISTGHN
jgi:hypothetical protein